MANFISFFISLIIFDFSIDTQLEMFIAPIITMFYLIKVKNKPTFLTLFLVTYTISDLINFYDQESYNEQIYFLCNGLYMLSYVFLFLEINKTVKMKLILKNFPIHFAVLSLLNIYIIFVMATIINPITFETTHIEFVRIFEHVYNIILLGLLSMSFFNYLLNENNKALLLFSGCLALTFFEFLLIGYYYLSDEMSIIRIVSILLELCAFLMFYFSASIKIKTRAQNSFVNY
ncbi:hypothetical protein [Xanthomarina sp. F2636L]|uniref:hypothetical protein n=1 Tax=Xanthomarina sp. F2636L TaxID=2996018 RepID=UPI00225E3E46|nr:hypothetical protein [Xanthomarina sp. F2636L]MCX7552199.1 hypothetical protein [Xanthomarina sp. F2636L]